jgi:hypothetical protein
VEIAVDPEPSDEERAALLEALAAAPEVPPARESRWLRAALLEAIGAGEP